MKPLVVGPSAEARPIAKVCGLARAEDVEVAAAAGADLLGFVSYPDSPRHLSDLVVVALASRARELGSHAVLVIVDAHRERVEDLVASGGLAAVQLCGDELPEHWRGTDYPVLRRIGVGEGAESALEAWAGVASAFVLDHPSTPGGSGLEVDADLALHLAQRAPCLLAGGLDGARLESGLAPSLAAAPFVGFDASSRLDAEPRRKDPDAVHRFVRAAHSFPAPSLRGVR